MDLRTLHKTITAKYLKGNNFIGSWKPISSQINLNSSQYNENFNKDERTKTSKGWQMHYWRTERETRRAECSGRQHKAYGACTCMHTHRYTHTHTLTCFDQEQSATFPQRTNMGKHGSRFTLLLLCPFYSTEDQEETHALVQFSSRPSPIVPPAPHALFFFLHLFFSYSFTRGSVHNIHARVGS